MTDSPTDPTADAFHRARIVLGVSGGIAAYKAAEVLRELTEAGHAVRVVPTQAALRFVGAATWAALSGEPVATDVWTVMQDVPHVRLGREAELVLVVPATADLLARAATGRADDLLTSTLLTATCPVLFAPAMHTEMWLHPATQANVATLRGRGAIVLEPAVGRLTGADSGPGRLPDPEEIALVAQAVLARGPGGWRADLGGKRVVVSAGGTREPLDPVRFLGNRSSGRQGYAFARAAVARGADVVVVAANVALSDVAGAKTLRVETTEQLRDAVLAEASGADVVVMAAAVADFRPAEQSQQKIKKTDDPRGVPPPVALARTPDVLAELGDARRERGDAAGSQVLVGFAAETDDVLRHGADKLRRKGCDLLVVNEVGPGRGFEVPHNAAVVLGADGSSVAIPRTSKDLLAHRVWDLVVARLDG